MSKLELALDGETDGIDFRPLERVIMTLNHMDVNWVKAGVVGLKLVDDDGIRALNKDYGGRDEITDVLSFNYHEADEPPQSEGELGDVVISQPAAKRQAKTAGTSLEDEIALLALHGVLHLYGFDHATRASQARLDELQEAILKAAGVQNRQFKWKND